MTSQERLQAEQSLTQLKNLELPDKEKSKLLDVILKRVFPPGDLPVSQETESAGKRIDSALVLLPLFESKSPFDEKSSAEIGRQVEMEVRASLNEKFVRAPAFLLLLAIVGTGVTVFSFGLFTFNKDARRADQIVNEFEKRLNDSNTRISASERELTKRLNDAIDSASSRIEKMQSDSMKAVSDDLKKRIDEVDTKKRESIQRMDSLLEGFQREKSESVQTLKDQASKMTPRIEQAGEEATKFIEKERNTSLTAFKQKADMTLTELGQPAIRTVLRQSYWFILGAVALSLISLLFSLRGIAKGRVYWASVAGVVIAAGVGVYFLLNR
jgi:hypothetical protein